MKKVFLILIFILTTIGGFAQNANRSGIFCEVGIGSVVRDNSLIETKINYQPLNNGKIKREIVYVYDNGLKLNIALGYRFSTSRYFAIELKGEAEAGEYGQKSLYLGVLPGIRYTSPELIGNMSIYTTLNAGFFINKDSAAQNPSFSIGVGLNLTTHFYLGAFSLFNLNREDYDCHDYGIYTDEYGVEHKERFNGSVGVNLGYRF